MIQRSLRNVHLLNVLYCISMCSMLSRFWSSRWQYCVQGTWDLSCNDPFNWRSLPCFRNLLVAEESGTWRHCMTRRRATITQGGAWRQSDLLNFHHVWPFRATCLIVNWAIDFKNAQMLKMGVVYYRYHSLSTLSLPLRSALSSFRSCPFLLCSLVRNPPGHWPMKTSVVQGTPGKLRLASLTAALNEQDMMTMDEEFQGSKCAGNVLCQLDANPHDSNLQNIANRVSPRIWSSFVNGA